MYASSYKPNDDDRRPNGEHSAELLALMSRLAQRCRYLDATCPGLRYVEFTGPDSGNEAIVTAAATAFSGGEEFEVSYDDDGAICLYGPDCEISIAQLTALVDDLVHCLRSIQSETSEVASKDLIPFARGECAAFIVSAATIRLAQYFESDLAPSVSDLGVEIQISSTHPRLEIGPIHVDSSGIIEFPGGVIARKPAKGWPAALLRSIKRGRIGVMQTPVTVFGYIAEYLECELAMQKSVKLLNDENHIDSKSKKSASSKNDHISPSEQAQMLGWKDCTSSQVLKTLARLRQRLINQGFPLVEQRLRGRGNKTWVLKNTWLEVTALLEAMTKPGKNARSIAEAWVAGDIPDGLKNRYWCNRCMKFTTTVDASHTCSDCGQKGRLRCVPRRRK